MEAECYKKVKEGTVFFFFFEIRTKEKTAELVGSSNGNFEAKVCPIYLGTCV